MISRRIWILAITGIVIYIAIVFQMNFLAIQRDGTTSIDSNLFLDRLHLIKSPPHQLYNPDVNITTHTSPYAYGRYNAPIPYLNFAPVSIYQDVFHRKKWHFVSVSSGDTIVGFAIADMGYITSGFVYYLNTLTNETEFEQVVVPKLPISTPLASTTVAATTVPTSLHPSPCSLFDGGLLSSLKLSICATGTTSSIHYDVSVNAKFKSSTSLILNATIYTTTASSEQTCGHFAMAYPLGPHRVAYTNKLANCATTGVLSISTPTTTMTTTTTSALMDYTNGMPSHLTVWYWVAISTNNTGGNWGMQLSSGVYSSRNGIGMENVFWYDGETFILSCHTAVGAEAEGKIINPPPGSGAVIVGREVSVECYDEKIRIRLTYHPLSEVPTTINTPLLSGSLLHTYGTYRGEIDVEGKMLEFEKVPGILVDTNIVIKSKKDR